MVQIQSQAQIPEEIKEEMEEMVEALKYFFDENGIKINISPLEIDEDGTAHISLESDNLIELSEDQFDDLIQIIRNSSYYNANGAENRIANYIGYKKYLIYDEFRSLYRDVEIHLKYYEEEIEGRITIYLDHITIMGNTTHYEEDNEEDEENETIEG